jgi:structure-specific recognition protein 1
LTIETKSGHSHTFNAVNKEEHEAMDGYLKSKKVRVTNQMADDVLNDLIGDDDDEEMQSVASSGSEEPTVRRGADVDDEDSEDGEYTVLTYYDSPSEVLNL